jgi:hypothetical protein
MTGRGNGDILAQVQVYPEDLADPVDGSYVDGRSFAKPVGKNVWNSFVRRVFSFPAMLGTLLVGIIFVAKRGFDVDPDFWWHLKIGEGILATHRWPTVDPYSFTAAGQPWMACEWLGDVLFATVERAWGLRGLDALLVVMSAAIIVALYALCAIRSGNSKASFVATIALLVMALPVLTMRPQMLGYLFLILTLIALERFRKGHRTALWFLPALFVVWINAHGSWVLGIGTLFVYWASGLKEFHMGGIQTRVWAPAERVRLSFVILLCLAVLSVTPYGTKLAAYPFQVASSLPVNMASINEWQPMPFNLLGGKVFLVMVLGLFAIQIAFELTWRLEELALLFFGTLMAFLHVRFILVFVPFFAPLLATVLARWVPGYERKKDLYLANAVLMLATIAGIVAYFPSQAKIQESITSHFPVRAIAFLHEHPAPGPIFNSYWFGGYLIWNGGAETKVFIDGRGELYEVGGVFSDYMHITHVQPGALSVLGNYGVQACLLDRNEPLVNFLAALPEWRRVYIDENSALFVRRSSTDSVGLEPVSGKQVAKNEPKNSRWDTKARGREGNGYVHD